MCWSREGKAAVGTLDQRRTARQRHEKPITIVGAGPAGLAAAIALARSGRLVVVKEWRATVGHRFHGDFQGLENWSSDQDVFDELKASGIAPTFDHLAVLQGTLFDSRGTAYPVHSARPLITWSAAAQRVAHSIMRCSSRRL
jgi:2-polyprenyl-6-methoxyphenol hydroxylase-like FAD-dependent oxidoreductase